MDAAGRPHDRARLRKEAGTTATFALVIMSSVTYAAPPEVRLTRVPEAGLQPLVAAGADGVVHLVYYKGDPKAGDLFYVRREKGGSEFGVPVRVNSSPGSAATIGTIRGGR